MTKILSHQDLLVKVAGGYHEMFEETNGLVMSPARRWHFANQSIEANPGMAWPYMKRAIAFINMSRPWEAVSDLDKALRCSSRSDSRGSSRRLRCDDEEARIRLLRGHAHNECLSYDRAAADFAAAAEILTAVENDAGGAFLSAGGDNSNSNIRVRPAHAKAGLAVAYCHMRRWSDAIRTGEIAIQNLPYDDAAGKQAAKAVDTARQHLASERRGAARIATEASRQAATEQQRASNKRVHSYRGSLNNMQSPLRKFRGSGNRQEDDSNQHNQHNHHYQTQQYPRSHNLGGGTGNISNMSMASLPKNLSITSIAMSLSMASINSDSWELPEPNFDFHSPPPATREIGGHHPADPGASVMNHSSRPDTVNHSIAEDVKREPQSVSTLNAIETINTSTSLHMHDDENTTTHHASSQHASPAPARQPALNGSYVDDNIGLDI